MDESRGWGVRGAAGSKDERDVWMICQTRLGFSCQVFAHRILFLLPRWFFFSVQQLQHCWDKLLNTFTFICYFFPPQGTERHFIFCMTSSLWICLNPQFVSKNMNSIYAFVSERIHFLTLTLTLGLAPLGPAECEFDSRQDPLQQKDHRPEPGRGASVLSGWRQRPVPVHEFCAGSGRFPGPLWLVGTILYSSHEEVVLLILELGCRDSREVQTSGGITEHYLEILFIKVTTLLSGVHNKPSLHVWVYRVCPIHQPLKISDPLFTSVVEL